MFVNNVVHITDKEISTNLLNILRNSENISNFHTGVLFGVPETSPNN